MPSQHDRTEVVISARGPAADRDETSAVLKRHGWDMRAGILAALRWIRADPEHALATLEPYRPSPKPAAGRGRPRRRSAED